MYRFMIVAAVACTLLLGEPAFFAERGATAAESQVVSTVRSLSMLETGHCDVDDRFAIVIHGGAVFWRGAIHAPKLPLMTQLLSDARKALLSGARAVDVVEAVIAGMEDSGLFNAGKGGIANQDGAIELDASIMDGRELHAGSVAAVSHQRNPIVAARLVMDKSQHVMMVGPNADQFARANGAASVDTSYFLHGGANFSDVPLPDDMTIDETASTHADYLGIWGGVFLGDLNALLVVEAIDGDDAEVIYAYGKNSIWGEPFYRRIPGRFVDGALNVKEPADLGGYTLVYRLGAGDTLSMSATHPDLPDATGTMKRLPARPGGDHNSGTVGAAVRDRCGDLAAGTSTGGFDSKIPGRVGDSPIIGAGTYANNSTAAISATGHGEFFMRHVVAYDITAAMKYKGLPLQQAANDLIKHDLRIEGLRGGIVAVDGEGNFVMTYNTAGMVRGVATDELEPEVGVY